MGERKTAALRLAGPLDTPTRYASGLLSRLRKYDGKLLVLLETPEGEFLEFAVARNTDLQSMLAILPGHAEVVFSDIDDRDLVVTGETYIPKDAPGELRIRVHEPADPKESRPVPDAAPIRD